MQKHKSQAQIEAEELAEQEQLEEDFFKTHKPSNDYC